MYRWVNPYYHPPSSNAGSGGQVDNEVVEYDGPARWKGRDLG